MIVDNEKLTTKEVRDAVDSSGLYYCLTCGIPATNIANEKLSLVWNRASAAIKRVEELIS